MIEHGVWGSSPLSRGIHGCGGVSGAQEGIIPALAGNTRCSRARGRGPADHPRSRGEYNPAKCAPLRAPGSSPLSRGIRRPASAAASVGRIIPALAGNTRPSPARGPLRWDHPRSRGEYNEPIDNAATKEGSSPLSRGIRYRIRRQAIPQRIIPALAGNTSLLYLRCCGRRDHPRSRGEYSLLWKALVVGVGSSPLSRGIRDLGSSGHD